MSANEVHLGDVGTVFERTVKDGDEVVDISGATTLEFYFVKPDGAKLTKTAVLSGSGLDGKMRYVAIAGDLNAAGDWRWQARVVLPSGEWKSDVVTFAVHGNL